MEQKILQKLDELGNASADRRGFLKQAGKVAVTVPAVAMLLSAQATPAEAYGRYGRKGGKGGKGNAKHKGHGKHKGHRSPKPAPKLRGFTLGGGKPAIHGMPLRRRRG